LGKDLRSHCADQDDDGGKGKNQCDVAGKDLVLDPQIIEAGGESTHTSTVATLAVRIVRKPEIIGLRDCELVNGFDRVPPNPKASSLIYLANPPITGSQRTTAQVAPQKPQAVVHCRGARPSPSREGFGCARY
jgi:hypothetical protein